MRLGLDGGKTFLLPPEPVTIQERVFCPGVCGTDLAVVYYDKADDLCYTNEGETRNDVWQAVLVVAELDEKSKKRTWNGTILARHGNDPHYGWWKQRKATGNGTTFVQCKSTASLFMDYVRMVVYKKTAMKSSVKLQK
jgi:hypothetical protein